MESTHSDQASQAAVRVLIPPTARSCSLARSLTAPLYRAAVSQTLRQALRSRAGSQLPRIHLLGTSVNNRPRKLGRRPELENAVPFRVRLGWLACTQASLYSRGYSRGSRGFGARLNGRLLTPLPGIPDNEYRTRNFNNAEVEVVGCWPPNKQCQGLYGSHECSGRDVRPAVRPVVQHSGEENHRNRDRDEYCGSQQESWSKCKAVNVSSQVLPQQLRIHQTDDIAVEVAQRREYPQGRESRLHIHLLLP